MKYDLVLFHAPSVYDFRERIQLTGPISDVIPSSSVFEMYPIGLTSMAGFLEEFGFRVRIVNLANRMLGNPRFDVEKKIRRLHARAFGIDLHWLPHAHGSIEIAKLLKKYHPNTPVIFGGLSASYFHEELIQYDCIDFVLRGDSTEKLLFQLLKELRAGKENDDESLLHQQFRQIPNLTWKTGGETVVNPLSAVPSHLDDFAVPDYRYTIRSVFKYLNLLDPLPYQGWLKYPNTVVLTARGCTQHCLICGGSREAYLQNCKRKCLALRSPVKLVEDIQFIGRFSRAPIFVLHDIRQGGRQYVHEFLDLLSQIHIQNELVFELFQPADDSFFAEIHRAVPKYSLEITLETHDEQIRQLNGKFRCSNQQVVDTLQAALNNGCRKIDLFFMVGLPHQSYQSALSNIDFCEQIHNLCHQDSRLSYFVAPLAPFLDPASEAFEHPERYGYKKLCHSLEDYRQRLTEPSWKYLLSYETDKLSRDDIVAATYESANRLNDFKFKYHLIDEAMHTEIAWKIAQSEEYIARIDEIMTHPVAERDPLFSELKVRLAETNHYVICGQNELRWEVKDNYANFLSLFVVGMELLFSDMVTRVQTKWSGKRAKGRVETTARTAGCTVEDAAARTVANTVEDAAARTVADTVEDAVASLAEHTVEDAAEDAAARTVEDTVEDAAARTVEDTVEDAAARTVEDAAMHRVGPM